MTKTRRAQHLPKKLRCGWRWHVVTLEQNTQACPRGERKTLLSQEKDMVSLSQLTVWGNVGGTRMNKNWFHTFTKERKSKEGNQTKLNEIISLWNEPQVWHGCALQKEKQSSGNTPRPYPSYCCRSRSIVCLMTVSREQCRLPCLSLMLFCNSICSSSLLNRFKYLKNKKGSEWPTLCIWLMLFHLKPNPQPSPVL